MKIDPRSIGLTLAALAGLGAIGGVAVVGLGLYDVSARTGHLPGVSWVLHTTFRQSVDLRAKPASAAPELEDPDLIALGAGHFDAACRDCHSAPGHERTATIRAMVPEPPHITEAVGDWGPSELHWIVHEGIKMSGMPAWPSPRDGEVWPVVAFLGAVEGMTREEYDALTVRPEAESAAFGYCAMCHGRDGDPENAHIPRLDILSAEYMALSLRAFRSGVRDSGIMEHAVSEVPEAALPDLARRFAEVVPSGEVDAFHGIEAAGRRVAAAGGSDDVPACAACHGPWPEPLNPRFPSLAGQSASYLATQLELWRAGARGGTDAAELMHQAARELTDDQITAVSAYYAALSPARLDDTADP